MKKVIYLFILVALASACSSPKYTYYFDHYDYNSGKKKAAPAVQTEAVTVESVIPPADAGTVLASANENEVYVMKPAPVVSNEEAVAKIKAMSKEERKALKKEVKKYVKETKKKESLKGGSPQALENDVKLAAIFGAVGIVLLIIGGDVLYILGAVALVIGLYFFIRWLSRQ